MSGMVLQEIKIPVGLFVVFILINRVACFQSKCYNIHHINQWKFILIKSRLFE